MQKSTPLLLLHFYLRSRRTYQKCCVVKYNTNRSLKTNMTKKDECDRSKHYIKGEKYNDGIT